MQKTVNHWQITSVKIFTGSTWNIYIPIIPIIVIRNRQLMRQLLLLQTWVKLLQIGATINNCGLYVTNLRNYYYHRDLLPMLRNWYLALNRKFLSPLTLIVLDNFVRLKFWVYFFVTHLVWFCNVEFLW